MNTPIRRTALLSLSALALVATACGDDDDSDDAAIDVTIEGAWVREPAAGTTATAAYASITNNGDTAVVLDDAESPVTDEVELHETLTADDGTMSMQERDEFVIQPGETLVMEPGGIHVMLLEIDPAQITGEIDITFEFDDAQDITVQAPVEPLPSGDDSMEGMDHSDDMGMDDTGSDTTEG